MPKLIRLLFLLLLSNTVSADYAECILENMKGVGSDVAAEEIKKACEKKWHSRSALSGSAIKHASESIVLDEESSSGRSPAENANSSTNAVSKIDALLASFGSGTPSPICAFHSFHCIPEDLIYWQKLNIGDEFVRNEPLLFYDGSLFRIQDDIDSKPYTGEMLSYYPSDMLASRVVFNRGVLNGKFERWYPTGGLAVSGSYKRGTLSGNYQEFFENGRERAQTVMNSGIPSKTLKLWYPNGVLRSDFRLTSSGSFNSWGKAWYEDGSIAFKGKFSRGKVFGEHTIYHPNGTVALTYKLIPGFEEVCYHDHPDLVKQQLSLRYGRSSLKSQLDYFTPNLECENSTPARVAKVASSKDEIGRVIWESDLKAFYLANPDGSLTSVEI